MNGFGRKLSENKNRPSSKEGLIVKLGYGVYAKTKKSTITEEFYLPGGFLAVACEALTRLGVTSLERSGFLVDEKDIIVRNEGQFITFIVTYPTIFPVAQVLKPHLALEFFLGELRTPSMIKPVTTLIRQTIGDKIIHPEFHIEVMSLEETAAAKWVALTRRVATMTRQSGHQDPNLVRHLYDRYEMQEQGSLASSFLNLIAEIIQQDQEQFKSHNAQYHKGPTAEIERIIKCITPIMTTYRVL